MFLSRMSINTTIYWITALSVYLPQSTVADAEPDDGSVFAAKPNPTEINSTLKSGRRVVADTLQEPGVASSHNLYLFMSETEQDEANKIQAAQLNLKQPGDDQIGNEQLSSAISPEHALPAASQTLNENERLNLQDSEASNGQLSDSSSPGIQYNGVLMRGSQVLELWVNNERCCSSAQRSGDLSFNSVEPNGEIRFSREGVFVEMHPGDAFSTELPVSN